MRFYLLFASLVTLLSFGCDSGSLEPEFCDDQIGLDAFIEANHADDNVITDADSGLRYIIFDSGTPQRPEPTSLVTANYTGILTNGNEFDSGQGARFPLNGVIAGWTIGLQKIGAGGSIRLFIPANLAYGRNPQPRGCSNAELVFDVELIQWVD